MDAVIHKLVMSRPIPRKLVERLEYEMAREPALSEREIDVLACIACGMNSPEIAERLFISPWTVSSHMKRIRLKLSARTVAQAVAIAIFEGILPRELVMPE